MIPFRPKTVQVEIDPAQVAQVMAAWDKIMPFIPPQCDPTITLIVENGLRRLSDHVSVVAQIQAPVPGGLGT